jgi:fructose 1,6-bisphosphate aldolase/phosphatase
MHMTTKTTVSLIKCDVGSLAGHYIVPEPILNIAEKNLTQAQETGLINSHYVFNAGDDLQLLMVHTRGESDPEIHQLAYNTFREAADKALALKLYGAGQDLLKNAFSGNIRGMGPGVAEMQIEERAAEPIVIFAADKTSAGAFNFPLFRIFADPMNTAGLVIDPNMAGGFKFEVMDTMDNTKVTLKTPEETYDLIDLIGTVQRYMVSRVWRANDNLICATGSVTRLRA